MAERLNLEVVAPIELVLGTVAISHIGTSQVGPRGEQGLPGEGSFWQSDSETTIKPTDSKTVSADYISGTIYGGLFQP